MSANEFQWCSWCHKKTTHRLATHNYLTRNDYKCSSCGNFTVQCRTCQNMATYKPAHTEKEGFFNSIKTDWASEFCAEHDGTIANFNSLNTVFNDLQDYEILFEKSKWNLAKVSKIAGGVVGGIAVFCPFAYLAAPGIAASLGSFGVLGSASTGTAISTLSGAALTSASLAAIGPGGMAGGVAFISAAGAALGARQGAVISNNYYGSIEDFKIKKVRNGSGSPVLFINGFLSQKNQDCSDWESAVSKRYRLNPYYYVTWESKTLLDMGKVFSAGVAGAIIRLVAGKLASKWNPLAWSSLITDLLGNPWHSAMVKSAMTGILLADLLARTKNDNGFILMGHSLGARVIYYLLNALSTKRKRIIQDVYLLGGAVGKDEEWNTAAKSVKGKIYNCYSHNDSVLKILYQIANGFSSAPIGINMIETGGESVQNFDATSVVDGHMVYKENFDKILARLPDQGERIKYNEVETTATKETDELSDYDKVVQKIIKQGKEGISPSGLVDVTGYSRNKINYILSRAKKQGEVANLRRGVYIVA